MLEAIQSNPYRVLGIYSNSPTKERLANHNRLKAFLKVGKSIPMDLDLPALLPPLVRTVESVAAAEAQLTLPKDQLLHAQFWFMLATPLDKVAMSNLISGSVDRSVSIWVKQGNVSSLQNRIVCELAAENYAEAIRCAETLYQSHLDEFVHIVLGEQQGGVTAEDLAHHFLDELCDAVGPRVIVPYIANREWKRYLKQRVVEPIINTLETAISASRNLKDSRPNNRLRAGQRLVNETKEPLAALGDLIPPSDIQYSMIVDKLAEEIANCAIGYYNDSDDHNAARNALKLLEYAESVAVGQQAKERCGSNVEGLQKVVKNLPPEEVMGEMRAIAGSVDAYRKSPQTLDSADSLLEETKPHLQSMRAKLGERSALYLKVSTTVVDSALSGVINAVNSAQEEAKMDSLVRGSLYGLQHNRLIVVLQSAWSVTQTMDTFDMDANYRRKRYDENRSILERLCEKCGIFPITSSSSGVSSSDTSGNSSSSQEWGAKWCLPVGSILGGIVGVIWGESFGALLGGVVVGLVVSVLIRDSIRNDS